jgi:hypothetical protein
MRRYDIVSVILLILSIIDFALAAPVLVQEKRQARVDVVHIPRDVITVVLEKRGDEELEKMAEEYFKTSGKPVESSDAHASSSPALPGPDDGPANVVQAPAPNPALSTAHPNPLLGPSSPSSTVSSFPNSFSDSDIEFVYEPTSGDEVHGEPLYTPTSAGSGLDHELTGAHAPQPNPNPNKRPWTDMNPDPDFDWAHWTAVVNRPSSPKKFKFSQANEYQVEHVQQPDPVLWTDSDFDIIYPPELVSEVQPPSMSAGLPAGPEHEVTPPSPGAGSPTVHEHEEMTPPSPDLEPLEEPEHEVVPGPPPTPESTDPELHSDSQPLSTTVQPEDLQAIVYAAKGKGKESRHISGTARDVGNAAQRVSLPDGRSLDLGE